MISFRRKIRHPLIQEQLNNIYYDSPILDLKDSEPLVIFSDLHIGNGKRGDDFKPNSDLFYKVLKRYYWTRGFNVILNGDIEELQRYNLAEIRRNWKNLYHLFDDFNRTNRLYKIFGNHDHLLLTFPNYALSYPLHAALRLQHKDHFIFVFHGHQASFFFQKFNDFIGIILRYLARPLRIRNYATAHDSVKRYRIENEVYDFSLQKKIVSIIGHTHRPLFETLSKTDSLKYKIEQLCRLYAESRVEKKFEIESQISLHKQELFSILNQKGHVRIPSRIYSPDLLVPSLFNSGCVIGKRGMTAIEIKQNTICLVHWFDEKVGKKYYKTQGQSDRPLGNCPIMRTVLNSDNLDYIFSRIKLLI